MGKMPTGFEEGLRQCPCVAFVFVFLKGDLTTSSTDECMNWWVLVTFTTALLVLLHTPRLHVCNAFSAQMYLLSKISLHFHLLKGHRTANQGLLALGNNATTLNRCNSIHFL